MRLKGERYLRNETERGGDLRNETERGGDLRNENERRGRPQE